MRMWITMSHVEKKGQNQRNDWIKEMMGEYNNKWKHLRFPQVSSPESRKKGKRNQGPLWKDMGNWPWTTMFQGKKSCPVWGRGVGWGTDSEWERGSVRARTPPQEELAECSSRNEHKPQTEQTKLVWELLTQSHLLGTRENPGFLGSKETGRRAGQRKQRSERKAERGPRAGVRAPSTPEKGLAGQPAQKPCDKRKSGKPCSGTRPLTGTNWSTNKQTKVA